MLNTVQSALHKLQPSVSLCLLSASWLKIHIMHQDGETELFLSQFPLRFQGQRRKTFNDNYHHIAMMAFGASAGHTKLSLNCSVCALAERRVST